MEHGGSGASSFDRTQGGARRGDWGMTGPPGAAVPGAAGRPAWRSSAPPHRPRRRGCSRGRVRPACQATAARPPSWTRPRLHHAELLTDCARRRTKCSRHDTGGGNDHRRQLLRLSTPAPHGGRSQRAPPARGAAQLRPTLAGVAVAKRTVSCVISCALSATKGRDKQPK